MSYAAAFLVALVATLAAGLATFVIQKKFPFDQRRRSHDVGSVVFLQFGVVFAVLLAFVFSGAWSEYNDAAQAATLEAGALHGAAMLAGGLPPQDAARVLRAELDYVEAVVGVEWPAMERRRDEDLATDEKLRAAIVGLAALRGLDADGRDARNMIQTLLTDAHAKREMRIYEARNGIPVVLWIVLIAMAAALTLSVSFSAMENTGIALLVASAFALGVAGIMIVARLLDYPYEGALLQPPTDFLVLRDKLVALLASVGPPS